MILANMILDTCKDLFCEIFPNSFCMPVVSIRDAFHGYYKIIFSLVTILYHHQLSMYKHQAKFVDVSITELIWFLKSFHCILIKLFLITFVTVYTLKY